MTDGFGERLSERVSWVVWRRRGVSTYRCRQGGERDTTGHQRGTNRDHLRLHLSPLVYSALAWCLPEFCGPRPLCAWGD
jgi:hypothetical protein